MLAFTTLILFTNSLVSFQSTTVEQLKSLDDFYQSFKEHPEAVFIVILAWLILMFILIKVLDVRITPWIALMCLILAFFIGLWYISTYIAIETP